jgi:hypothetical protein
MKIKQKRRTSKPKAEPRVGIFWLLRNQLVIDSVPLSQAERYDERLTFPASHIDVWKRLQEEGRAPIESEYDEPPRGRVIFEPSSREFLILADACILARKQIMNEIVGCLHLPQQVKLDSDSHYRCWRCLYGNLDDETA